MTMRMIDLIAAKREGRTHSPEELSFIAEAAAKGAVPDYQLSAWLMAVCLRGMKAAEAADLTRAMARSGARLDFSAVPQPKADKHSTGGVGDGISLALAPLAAACGLCVPMMSGRGLGHTGGTLDKLESIPGFKVRLSPEAVREQIRGIGVCLFGQSEDLAPADRKLYALRDATATVASLPLIVASILSKKLCEGLDALVIDVKSGSGAIFKTAKEAEALGKALVGTAGLLGLKSAALVTAMEQPLGRYVGNALEVRQAVEVLRGEKTAPDYLECLLALGGWMLHLSGLAKNADQGARKMQAAIDSGEGFKRLKLIAQKQGGDAAALDDLDRLPKASSSRVVAAPRAGFVTALDARKVGRAAVFLGAGRDYAEEALDYGAGMRLEKKVGDRVAAGETLAVLYSSDEARLRAGEAEFLSAVAVGARRPRLAPVVRKIIRSR
ncbi:MAG TPA: thymidine phosphorylase [Elusimicrobiota bacterium]|nr:thymidine phosphorylase [Elusimicrobiota bacterium]